MEQEINHMYTQKRFFKNVYRAVGILFTLIGVIFLGVSLFSFISFSQFRSHAVPAQGTIRYIASEAVLITYEANGQEMTRELGYRSSSMKAGDSVSIYYDPMQPEHIETAASLVLSWAFLGVGGLLFLTGMGLILWEIRKQALRRRLLESGLRLNGEVAEIEINRRISSNRRHPYVVKCRCRMPDGTTQSVHSDSIWHNPQELLPGSFVPVYVDEQNYKRYYVDLSRVLREE